MKRLLPTMISIAFAAAFCVHPEACAAVTHSASGNFRSISGIYPHLAMFNEEMECGTGAVVPWADRLWVVTYAPHAPTGSTDKLYEITPGFQQIIRPESIGGTPANRLIHRESGQLFIGPYAIDAQRNVRVIPYKAMYGRPTGNARHLEDPAGKLYYATMEEGIYEVDVKTLGVTELWTDEQKTKGRHAGLPGYHGKGFYSGQGRLVYANNGEHGEEARRNPNTPSGALAEWDGRADAWKVVRRNQFTEVTGPGGIHGNANPATDPIWTIGWDHRSLILMVLDHGNWTSYRLPKASHCYDGAHGWNTEWPRIRDVGEDDLLLTMHGMFWRFPRAFSAANAAGIAPHSTYLKVIGDFCRWNDRIVFGCDDTAKNEFLNRRRAKGSVAPPQSHSNLWFVRPSELSSFGPAIGHGAVWLEDDVPAGVPGEPFLFSGFQRRALHLIHATAESATITLEADLKGNGQWTILRKLRIEPQGCQWIDLSREKSAAWLRLKSDRPLRQATAWFDFRNQDKRSAMPDPIFSGLAAAGERTLSGGVVGGVVRALDRNQRTLQFSSVEFGRNGEPRERALYELDADLILKRIGDADAAELSRKQAAIPVGVLSSDSASVMFVDDSGRRWRLPKGDAAFEREEMPGPSRVDREVATERDLFNAHGTFYELPAENAGGFAKIRPVATHNRRIIDYCSYRGLLVMSGIQLSASARNPHIIRSEDGKAALWVGVLDDLWKSGKPRGVGGPWNNTSVAADQPSDPYLMNGYDRKKLVVSHSGVKRVNIAVEVDVTGTGLWRVYRNFAVPPGRKVTHRFPAAFQAYWVRLRCDRATAASGTFIYE